MFSRLDAEIVVVWGFFVLGNFSSLDCNLSLYFFYDALQQEGEMSVA